MWQYTWAMIIILTVIIISIGIGLSSYDLTGVWVANPDFANEAGIKEIILYIGEKVNGAHSSYLYITNSTGQIIEDQSIIINVPKRAIITGKYSVQIENSNSWSDVNTMNIVRNKNVITFFDSETDTVYAELFKDNSATEYSKKIS